MRGNRRAVFLDRDGVLNACQVHQGKPLAASSLEGLTILPDVPDALADLRMAGFLLIGVTNQPDVGRGSQSREVVEAIHGYLLSRLPLTDLLVCYEADEACPRRKPNPGMLLEAADKYDINLAESFLVGDRWKDIEAGRRAGCRTIFLDHGYAEPKPSPPASFTTQSLREAAFWILGHCFAPGGVHDLIDEPQGSAVR